MRELALNEIDIISGGAKPNDGYTFSHIVSNGLTIGIICAFLGSSFGAGFVVGSSYAALMMTAKALDNYFFPEIAEPVVVTQSTFIDPAKAQVISA